MNKESNLNNSSLNILKRNNLDFEDRNKDKKDAHSINSENWALKLNFENHSNNDKNKEKNKFQNIQENHKEPEKLEKSLENVQKIVVNQNENKKEIEIKDNNNEEISDGENYKIKEYEESEDTKKDKGKEKKKNKQNNENNKDENKENDAKVSYFNEYNNDVKNEEIIDIKDQKEVNEIDDELVIENKDKKEFNDNKNKEESMKKLKTEENIENEEKDELLESKNENIKNHKSSIKEGTSDKIYEVQNEKEFRKEFEYKKEEIIKEDKKDEKDNINNVDENEIIKYKLRGKNKNSKNGNKSNRDREEKNNNERHKLKIKEEKLEENKNESSENNKIGNKDTRKKGKSKNKRDILASQFIEKKLNLDEIGKIKIAEKHAQANRILKQINKFNKFTQFCPCCCLPCPQEGILESFSYCEDTDDFVDLGQGTSLYFSFFKYSIIIIAATALIIGIPFLIFSFQYTYSLQKLCNYYYLNEFIYNRKTELFNYCKLYITVEEYSSDYYSFVDSPFFLFSTVNIKDYREIYYIFNNEVKNTKFEQSILNYPLLNLICSITLLIINMLFTIIIYNKNISYDFKIISPSDYTVLITNMNGVLSHYLNIRKKYEEMLKKEPNKLNEDGTPFDFQNELNKELGILGSNSIEDKSQKYTHRNFKRLRPRLKEFSDFVENNICIDDKKVKYNIQQLNICFKLNDFMMIEEELHDINTKIVKTNNHPYQIEKNKIYDERGEERRYFGSILSGYNLYWFNCCDKGIKLSELEKQKKEKERKIIQLLRKTEEIDENNFAGVAFVSFNTIKEQEDFISQFPDNILSYLLKIIFDLKYIFCFCCIKKNLKANLNVTAAFEPEDVIFENLEYSSVKRTIRTIIVYIISIILIGICLGIFIGLNLLQDYVNNEAIHLILSYIISLCNTCVSSCLNMIFQMVLDYLTKREKQYTMTEYYRSYSVKLTLFTFFTSAVVPLICELIHKSDGYEILISNMLMMFLVNAFVTPIMWTMNFTYFLKKFRICLINCRKDPDDEDKNHNMTQRELNELYELPDMSISYKYSYLAKTLLMTFLYIPIFPLGIVISLAGFVLGYLLEKFNYAYMYKRPEMLNHRLCVFYVNHFDVIFFVYAIGDYIFMYDSHENRIIPLVKIIIFGIITALPYSKFLKKIFIGIHESDTNSYEYKDQYFTFSTDYERSNPITRKKGIKHYLQKLLDSKKITPEKYNELLSNADSLNLMEVYYESRQNKDIFDSQRKFALQAGKKFSKLIEKIIENNPNNNNDDINRIFVEEENAQPCNEINNFENNYQENKINKKEEGKNIADIYNNPFFMDYGCTIQSYVNQIINADNDFNLDRKDSNLNEIEENKEDMEDEKEI